MLVVINEIVLPVGYSYKQLIQAAAGRLRLKIKQVELYKVLRRSVDTRNLRKSPRQIVNAVFETPELTDLDSLLNVEKYVALEEVSLPSLGKIPDNARPVVIGAGPAGLLAALVLAKAGARPILLERGKPIEERSKDVGLFWGMGEFNTQSNVLFGEGGAGTFSDGKLTSRSKDRAMKELVLQTLVDAGADAEIMYEAFAHIGSDRLAEIIPNISKRILELGGDVFFNSCVSQLLIEDGNICGVVVNGDELECRGCILACGHGADDVYEMLESCGVEISARDFALGVRVELPQAAIDRAMLGDFAKDFPLGAASYRLTAGGDCHTFCMCPGGRVIACSARENSVGTNGMSLSSRNGEFGNAAFLVSLPQFSGDKLSGMRFLEEIENKAFSAAGGEYNLPACGLPDFTSGSLTSLPESRSCQRATLCDFSTFMPDHVLSVLKEKIPQMLRKLPYLDPREAVLYGPETRSTSPVRVLRGEDMQSVNTQRLFPAGEGSGYSGGIISSAIDGAKAAVALLNSLINS